MLRALAPLLLAVLLACSSSESSSSEAPTPKGPTTGASSATAKSKVALIGASVTVGFLYSTLVGGSSTNTTASVADVFELLWSEQIEPLPHGDLFMFQDPDASGERQVAQAIADEPALVVAIDFLFWFVHLRGEGEATRLAGLERGIALLDTIKTPIIIGDVPNMRGADPKMLAPSAVPSDETLAKINARIEEFASQRPRVTRFPLAAWVAQVRASGYQFDTKDGAKTAGRDQLLQTDLLHASRLGMVAVADKLQPLLRRALPSLGPHNRSIDQMFERFGVALETKAPTATH